MLNHFLGLQAAVATVIGQCVSAVVTMILDYSMSGLGNGMVNMAGTAIRQLILFVPLAYLFARYLLIGAVWYSMWIAEVAAVLYAVSFTKKILKEVSAMQSFSASSAV